MNKNHTEQAQQAHLDNEETILQKQLCEKEMDEYIRLIHRERMLKLGHKVAEVLLTASEEDTPKALMTAKEIMGQFLGVDRVQIWRYEEIQGELCFVLRYDWLSEIGKQKTAFPIGFEYPYSKNPEWLDMFLLGKSINGPVSKMPKNIVDSFEGTDTVSIVILPLYLNEEILGFFSIHDCKQERVFTDDEVAMLTSVGLMLTSVFNRMELAQLRKEMETEERANFILEATPIAVILHDRNMKPIDCNERAAKMLGFTNKDEYLQKFYTLTTPNQPDGIDSIETVKYYQTKAFNEGYARMPEFICRRIDGTLFPIESTYMRIRYKNDFAIIEYSRDITERVAAREKERQWEMKLREQEVDKRIRLMFDATPLMIEYWDKDYNVIDCNRTTLDYYLYSNKDEYQKNPYKHSPSLQPDGSFSQDQWRQNLKKIFDTGSGKFEYMLDVNGETAFLEVEGILMTYNNELVVATYSNDVTQLRKLQKEQQRVKIAEESNKAKSIFLARMSHEIRTPVTAVLGISEIQLQNPDLPPLIEESFAKIHNSTNLLLGIINDILDHSKIESGKMTITNEEYELANLISDVAHLYLVYLDNKDIKFNIYVDEHLPEFLIGDALRIEQVMNNLLSNAFKYTKCGTVELYLQCKRFIPEQDAQQTPMMADGLKEDNVLLIITVKDTGLGMTEEQLKNLYNEYERFHERHFRSVSGAGLGMSIVYSLLQLMDAQIDIESEVDKGTNVIVQIPQKIIRSEVLGKEAALRLQQFEEYTRAAAKRYKFEPKPMPYGKVLIVDDVEANLYVTKGLLAFYELNVETCDNGYDAIDKIKNGMVYDLVFMDYMMPGLDGLETMLLMRDMGYTHPIVALTANAMIGQAEKFIESGFDSYISKPIQTKHLNTILTKHIRDKQPPGVLEEVVLSRLATGKISPAEGIETYLHGEELQKKLRSDFARNQKKAFIDISQALNTGDNKTAHRLAHTLKSTSGLIGENTLERLSERLENIIADDDPPSDTLLSELERELTRVLEGISAPEKTSVLNNNTVDKSTAIALFDKLSPLLKSQNADSLMLLDELRTIPEAAILVRQIENIDFAGASNSITILKEIFEGGI